jgi:hypothetical protein
MKIKGYTVFSLIPGRSDIRVIPVLTGIKPQKYHVLPTYELSGLVNEIL